LPYDSKISAIYTTMKRYLEDFQPGQTFTGSARLHVENHRQRCRCSTT